MVVYYYLFLKEIQETVSDSVCLLDTLSDGGMTSLKFIKHLHCLLEIIICQKEVSIRWIVIALVEFVPDLRH